MAIFVNQEGGKDGDLTFDEACAHVTGLKLQGPETRPIKSDRKLGDIGIGDLPVRQLDSSSTKIEQFADCLMYHHLDVTDGMFENIYKVCYQGKYAQLPEPFSLKKEPMVPYTLQIIILSTAPPSEGDANGAYVHIFKHVYLHKNKINAKDAIATCRGNPLRFDWGSQTRLALSGLNYMMDRLGGKQLRHWLVKPKFEKKLTVDQQAREEGYRSIREFDPRANNRNQFMEWTDEQVHVPGGKIEGWSEGKVKAESLTKFKPGVFDDGMLQRMDASFLKAFLNPSVDNEVFKEMSVSKIWQISYQNFKNLINPSFAGLGIAAAMFEGKMAPKFCYALRVATMILLRRVSSVTEMVKQGMNEDSDENDIIPRVGEKDDLERDLETLLEEHHSEHMDVRYGDMWEPIFFSESLTILMMHMMEANCLRILIAKSGDY
ncbi:hypothetical protein AK812_SmicGene42011 [Symbiodinium microadriaticum]|uniref:Uncharacterized protein n=1 Tax=Symbiodinium microadriaticum TaxID=2951 RepID=A0A1Q9C4R1_SYMMI|nr:hypothetical protein AK812_SmicGene42011 [Symbiodinium microadriaticum]